MTGPSAPDPLLDRLNPEQRAAVGHPGGPLLIAAGAGSGKTRVLTHRIARLIRDGLSPGAILGVTFTNKAAREMRARVGTLTGGARVLISTYHAFAAAFLRAEFPSIGRSSAFTIYDEGDSLVLIRQILEELSLSAEHHKPGQVRERISTFKNDGRTPEEVQRRAAGTVDADVAAIYAAYDRRLLEADACDFDDLLSQTERLLRDHPATRERWSRTYEHVLVDEFQDTNRVQYEIVRLLAAARNNLCVTGDQDQSIYSWRGADPEIFDRFLADHQGATIIPLQQNYRSTGHILAAASDLIAHNRHRVPKRLWTEGGDGEPVRVVGFGDDWEEALSLAAEISRSIAEGEPPQEIAVLFRTNALSLPVEQALLQERVPYRVIGGLEFFARTEVKDLMAWLRFLVNPSDLVSFARLLDAPPRGLGETTRAQIAALARAQSRPVGGLVRDAAFAERLPSRARRAAQALRELLLSLDALVAGGASLGDLIQDILHQSGFEDHWRKKSQKGGSLDPWQNLGQLVSLARHMETERRLDLATFLGEVTLLTDLDRTEEGAARVNLLTLHSAKGLEFDTVFIAGVEEGLLPHNVSRRQPRGEEEERRLLHVGMTRARKRLALSWAMRRGRFGVAAASSPSHFLSEIGTRGVEHYGNSMTSPGASARDFDPEDDQRPILDEDGGAFDAESSEHPLAGLRAGSRVRHDDYGVGKVTDIRGRLGGLDRKIVVVFAAAGTRQFILRHARLELLDAAGDE